jgi:hypothetical protein
MANPVIFVVDTRDKVGEALVTAHIGKSACDKFTKQVKGAVPTFFLAVELNVAKKKLALIAPGAREALSRRLPPGAFWVVVVANGGNTYAALRVPA